ncbi:MAG: acyl-CoA dehydrogenase [Alphaproteobacteria bacterium]|nr:acyl-CoA dehydrogenase [Alphaproteobacteria bacterium]
MAVPSPYYTEEHHAFRASVRRFVEREIEPHVETWEAAGELPRELHRKAAAAGLLGIGYPEEFGGTAPDDPFLRLILAEEVARAGSGGVHASLFTHGIAIPPIVAVGSDELKRRVLPPVLAGEKIAALAITEPGGGSDVANLRTRGRREGEELVIDGEKTLITSGMRADFYSVAVRTGGPGAGGVSLVLIERERAGFTRSKLEKMGWWCSDTATLRFEGVRVPMANVIGGENQGFRAIMLNFNAERFGLAALALGFAQLCRDEALAWARQRQTFGKPLIGHQAIRHLLADMTMKVNATRAFIENLGWRLKHGEQPVSDICLAKNLATEVNEFCADAAVQIFGGMGFMRGTKVERVYRETKVLTIGGGSREIMKDLAMRQLPT